MSRRSMLVQAVRKNQTKQTKALVFVIPSYIGPEGSEPVVFGAPEHRPPTRSELITAIVAAGYTQEVAVAAAERELKKQSHPDAAHE